MSQLLETKFKRFDVVVLKNEHPEKFGRFIMALKALEESDDWSRICGIHGNTFKPNDPGVICPTDPKVVSVISQTGEPFYCKHSVFPFIAWHTPYVYQFELLLNKYSSSKKHYITLPYMDLTNFSNDFSFINEPTIVIFYEGRYIRVENPLASAYYYVNGVKTKIVRKGFLTPSTKKERMQLTTVKKQLNNALYAERYEVFSSLPVAYSKMDVVSVYVPLETPHNSLHDIIGGDGGNMSDITISAFDPLFWLHHCNMDRHFYTWLYKNTDKFRSKLSPPPLTSTCEASHAPFFKNEIYSHDFNNYKYGWMNGSGTYMKLEDTLCVEKFPFTYDIIHPTPKEDLGSFVELIDIPIPMESVSISVYFYLKTEQLDREKHFAGSAFWFGINRRVKACERCEVTRTNIKIDIEEFVKENNITKSNISNYNLVIEGNGRMNTVSKTYIQNEIVQDGRFEVILL